MTMWNNVSAEMLKLVKRPANWLLLGVAVTLGLVFGYLVPYAGYTGETAGPRADAALTALLPSALVGNSVAGLPVFLGGIMMIFGVLAVGSEYGWETWKTVLAQGPSRMAVYAGKLAALAVAALAVVLAMFATGALASMGIAAAEGQSMAFPALAELAQGIGGGWLMASMWAAFGAALAVLLRGIPMALGLGLVWLLAVQNLLALLAAPLLDWVAELQKGLPGPNAGSLAAALGSSPGTPGVEAVVGGGQAALVLAAYLIGFVVLGAAVLRRRDIL